MSMLNILITNDDGIAASGIICLAKAAIKYGHVTVVAPKTERSAASHSITLRDTIEIAPYTFPVTGVEAFSTSGSPSDCVRLGILNLLPNKPDIVLCGINNGYNAGCDVQYSATIGAAMEAVFQGIPAVAFSEGFESDGRVANVFLDAILEDVLQAPFRPHKIINVNFPDCDASEVKGILRDRICSDKSLFKDIYEEESVDTTMNHMSTDCTPPDSVTKDTSCVRRFRVVGLPGPTPEAGSDLKALFDHYISIGTVTNIH